MPNVSIDIIDDDAAADAKVQYISSLQNIISVKRTKADVLSIDAASSDLAPNVPNGRYTVTTNVIISVFP